MSDNDVINNRNTSINNINLQTGITGDERTRRIAFETDVINEFEEAKRKKQAKVDQYLKELAALGCSPNWEVYAPPAAPPTLPTMPPITPPNWEDYVPPTTPPMER